MDIKWVGAHTNNFGVGRNGSTVNKIVMHWIVGTLSSADTTFNSPTRYASAHYGVGPSEVHQYVAEENTAWHASNLTINRQSIGIEHEGGRLLLDGTREKPTEATLKRSAELVASICKRYNLPIDRNTIRIHKEYSATQCPGTLDVDRIITLAKEFNATPPPATVTDQSKYDFQGNIGVVELQRARSIMREYESQINNLTTRISKAKSELG